MSGNHESSREIIVVGPQLLVFEDKNRKLLEIDSFLPSHTYLESCQTIKFEEKILGTLGDALSNLIFYLLLPQIENEITSCMIHLCFVFPSKLYHLYIRRGMYGVTTLITSLSCGPTNLSPSFLWFGQKKLMYSFKKKKLMYRRYSKPSYQFWLPASVLQSRVRQIM